MERANCRTWRGLTTSTSYAAVASSTIRSGSNCCNCSTSWPMPRASLLTCHCSPLGTTATSSVALLTSIPTTLLGVSCAAITTTTTPGACVCLPRPGLADSGSDRSGPGNCSGCTAAGRRDQRRPSGLERARYGANANFQKTSYPETSYKGTAMTKIAFIGLGTMGSRMVNNLQNARHELVVFDTRQEASEQALTRGARWAETPADAARQAEVILSSVPGPKEVELVALGEGGIIHGAQSGAIYADVSTSSPTLIRRIYQAFKPRNVQVVDAPVSGGAQGAQDATLQIMVGCDADIYERIKPVLLGIGDKITYIGDVGAGEVAKLVHNEI